MLIIVKKMVLWFLRMENFIHNERVCFPNLWPSCVLRRETAILSLYQGLLYGNQAIMPNINSVKPRYSVERLKKTLTSAVTCC